MFETYLGVYILRIHLFANHIWVQNICFNVYVEILWNIPKYLGICENFDFFKTCIGVYILGIHFFDWQYYTIWVRNGLNFFFDVFKFKFGTRERAVNIITKILSNKTFEKILICWYMLKYVLKHFFEQYTGVYILKINFSGSNIWV